MALSNKQVIEKINEAFLRGDIEGVLSYCADNIVWAMVGSAPIQGKDAVRKSMQEGPGEPPNFTVRALVADGDYVAATGDLTMHENGRPVSYSYCDVWRLQGGKAVELNAFVIKTEGVTT